jgi:methyl-accepting chemotaxis protein
MKAQTGNDFAMFIAKKNLDRSEWARTRGTARNGWDDWPDVVVVKSTTFDQDSMVDADAVQGGGETLRVLSESRRDGAAFARGVFPVRDSSGAVVGGLVVRHDVSALKASMWSGLQQAAVFLIPLALLASALVYFLVDRLIFRRLNQMKSTMEDLSIRLAGGDFSVTAATRATKNDEIGAFEAFFGEFLVLVGNTMGDLAARLKLQRQAGRPTVPPNP